MTHERPGRNPCGVRDAVIQQQMLDHFFLSDPLEDFSRYKGQTNRPVARWGMTPSFLVNRDDSSLLPDTWDLPVFNGFFQEKSESGAQGIHSFLKYSRLDVVRPHWAVGATSKEAFPNSRNTEADRFERVLEVLLLSVEKLRVLDRSEYRENIPRRFQAPGPDSRQQSRRGI